VKAREYLSQNGQEWPKTQEYGKVLGVSENYLRNHYGTVKEFKRLVRESIPGFTAAPIPDPSVPIQELVDRLKADFSRGKAFHEALKWHEKKFSTNEPIGIGFIGDPHVDNPGTDWPLLDKHLELFERTPGLYGLNLGDTTDNWVGNLARLYAYSAVTKSQAIQLAEYVIKRVKWLGIIMGNHDLWSGADNPLEWIARSVHAATHEWEAKIRITFPNGWERRIWARHDFPGHSQFNPTHAQRKKQLWTGAAHVYAAGHRHEWAITHNEDGERGESILLRARGYKSIDSYATVKGYESQSSGSTVCVVFDPNNRTMNAFADLQEGAEFLTWKRARK
jgi:hypothetical protein